MQTEKRASSQGATWGLAILFGVVGASIQQNVGAFFIGAAIGALIAQILHLRSRTETLDQQVQELKQRLAGSKAAPDATAAPNDLTPTRPIAPTPALHRLSRFHHRSCGLPLHSQRHRSRRPLRRRRHRHARLLQWITRSPDSWTG